MKSSIYTVLCILSGAAALYSLIRYLIIVNSGKRRVSAKQAVYIVVFIVGLIAAGATAALSLIANVD